MTRKTKWIIVCRRKSPLHDQYVFCNTLIQRWRYFDVHNIPHEAKRYDSENEAYILGPTVSDNWDVFYVAVNE